MTLNTTAAPQAPATAITNRIRAVCQAANCNQQELDQAIAWGEQNLSRGQRDLIGSPYETEAAKLLLLFFRSHLLAERRRESAERQRVKAAERLRVRRATARMQAEECPS